MYAASSSPLCHNVTLYVFPCHTPEFIIPAFPSPMRVYSTCCNALHFHNIISLLLSLFISTCTLPSISDPISPSCVQVSLKVCHATVVVPCVKKVPVKSNVHAFNFVVKGSIDELTCANVRLRKQHRKLPVCPCFSLGLLKSYIAQPIILISKATRERMAKKDTVLRR